MSFSLRNDILKTDICLVSYNRHSVDQILMPDKCMNNFVEFGLYHYQDIFCILLFNSTFIVA